MGRRWFLRFLLVSCLLALFSSHEVEKERAEIIFQDFFYSRKVDSEFGFVFKGFGRKLMETGEDSSVLVSRENHRKSRKMITVMDYADPEPNVNLRTGYIFTPPPQPN